MLNEADQFLSSRSVDASSGADKMYNQMQNIFLEQIEKFDGLLIATTNLLETIDPAFSRRFDYKIAFEKPDLKQRLELWKTYQSLLLMKRDLILKKLATYPLSGGQICLIVKNTALKVAIKPKPIFCFEDFKLAIDREAKGAFGDVKSVGL